MTETTTLPLNQKPQAKLPRGVRRRAGSIQIYLTHPDGRVERRSLGRVTVRFAVQQREIFMRDIAEGKYLKPVPRVDRILFSAVADKALEHAQNYKRFWDGDASRIRLLKEWWGDRFADSITTDEINAKLLECMRERGWSEATSNEYRTSLCKMYALAIDRGELTVNPARKAHRYKLNNARTRELSYAEEDRLRAAIAELYPAKMPEFDLALHTGVRKSNLYGTRGSKRRKMEPLQWDAVNLDWKILTLPRSKAGFAYSVPLNSVAVDALKVLRERSDGTGAVIRKPSGREIYSCRKWFEACLKKAAITGFCWHDVRHSFATRLRRNRTPIEDIAALLGHDLGKNRMTARYAHADIDRLREAVESLVKTSRSTDTKTDTRPVLEFSNAKTG
jgi:integrase